jgi:hypothetical protein
VGCCDLAAITGLGTSGLFLYKGDYSAANPALVSDAIDLNYPTTCEKNDVFSVCEKFGIIRVDTLSFQFVGMSKDLCPNGDSTLVCSGGAYY